MKHYLLKCPEYGCEVKPTVEEIRGIINKSCFDKYEKFTLNTKVAQDKDLLFCTTPDCEHILNVNNAMKNKITCTKCCKSTCVKCKMPWHGTDIDCQKN